MKISIISFYLFLGIILAFTSCSDDKVNDNNEQEDTENYESNEGESAALCPTEDFIRQQESDEAKVESALYSQEDSIKYDAMVQDLIAIYNEQGTSEAKQCTRATIDEDDTYANTCGINEFESSGLIVEQKLWDSGQWGKTRYGGFDTFYRTFSENMNGKARRMLLVVFYHKNGFPNKRTAYLKLGQVNNGPIVGEGTKAVVIPAQYEYGCIKVCIDDYLPANGRVTCEHPRVPEKEGKIYGLVNFFPFMKNEETGGRFYLNPICVKSVSSKVINGKTKQLLMTENWESLNYHEEIGRVNGVPVYFNDTRVTGTPNIGGGVHQCVELCSRYIKVLNKNIKRTGTWSNAEDWPTARANDNVDPGKYIVFKNGERQVREGDIVVFGPSQHIGVVFKTTAENIYIAHQNSGVKCRAIGTGFKKASDGKTILNEKANPDDNGGVNPIGANIRPQTFIRINNSAEEEDGYRSLEASTTDINFGMVKIGETKTVTVSISNKGTETVDLTDYSITKNRGYELSSMPSSIPPNITKTFTISFTPSAAGAIQGKVTLKSNASDNPTWYILLKGFGDDGKQTKGTINGHEYVDLGLPSGTLWATCNIGANKPEDYGTYFNRTQVAGVDVAYKQWQGTWRIPTIKEYEELMEFAEYSSSTFGHTYTGLNGESLFFPFTGVKYSSFVDYGGLAGFFWCTSDYWYILWSAEAGEIGDYDFWTDYNRVGESGAITVRPVSDAISNAKPQSSSLKAKSPNKHGISSRNGGSVRR